MARILCLQEKHKCLPLAFKLFRKLIIIISIEAAPNSYCPEVGLFSWIKVGLLSREVQKLVSIKEKSYNLIQGQPNSGYPG